MLVAVGGAAGSVARYLLSKAVQEAAASAFPWGTMTVNIAGCLLIGFIGGLPIGGGGGQWDCLKLALTGRIHRHQRGCGNTRRGGRNTAGQGAGGLKPVNQKTHIKMKSTFNRLSTFAVAAAVAIALGSCDNRKFNVKGEIAEAKDSVLYFENMSLDGPVTVDSVKLGDDGAFSFSEKSPEAPEFYRLRIAGQIINLSVDSTETITVKASYPAMATGYTVEGSAECATIKELALKQIDLQRRVIAVQRNATLGFDQTNDSIARMIEAYKKDIKMNYIYKAPMRASSYFALFQTLGNMLIFNPRENEDDIKAFAAVATSWDTYHPKAVRGQNLHNIAIQGMRDIRIMKNQQGASCATKGLPKWLTQARCAWPT